MTPRKKAVGPTERERYEAEVAAYVEAGGSEDVQRVITAVHGLHRRLSQWYTQSLTDVGLSGGEWGVISQLATAPHGTVMTPTQLASAAAVAPSSMTHRLDKMSDRGLIKRTPDLEKRTRVLVTLTEAGWQMFQQVVKNSDVVESDVLERLTSAQRDQLADLLELAITGVDDALAT
ncbi:MarR family winged helix-turn-helix transcriptional regulator [Luteipulveratus mongoliensis]|uniref:MarR family transcriptional regulator n=1 Tax=Luteipulveratus mongoliensis TaxID=571913 RepID=A0A0K1JKW4_9MICO|nr:MarR family winged helix-turn-helix transcriptional regulator [Luteipulveratus mongoliensis]AKU17356.1 MarR family transcriptional regulator [Luteipulveratus mongoliensis]